MARNINKRPCRICKKWFVANPRVGTRQKTCGSNECKKKWHAKKCTQWNKKNRAYFQAIHLSKKLQAVQNQEASSGKSAPKLPKSGKIPKLPQEVIQDVIGEQQFVIVEYLSRVLLCSVQEVMHKQYFDITEKIDQLPRQGYSRIDRRMRPP